MRRGTESRNVENKESSSSVSGGFGKNCILSTENVLELSKFMSPLTLDTARNVRKSPAPSSYWQVAHGGS